VSVFRLTTPLTTGDFTRLAALGMRVFETFDDRSLAWRLGKMPDVSIFVAAAGERLVGFKAGYAATENRYYSWLGGVDPDWRGQGLASELMTRQHEWLRGTNYALVETHVRQDNDVMVALNLKHGLRITGMFLKRGEPNYVMQREFQR